MTRITVFFILLLLLGGLAFAWDDNPMVGKWDCTSKGDDGPELTWTLEVKETGGKLSATLSGGPEGQTLPLIDPKLEGTTFTFKVQVNPDETVEVAVKLDGNKFVGRYTGKTAGSGEFKGNKTPSGSNN